MKKIFGSCIALATMFMACNSTNTMNSSVTGKGDKVESQQAVWDQSYGGRDKAYDTTLLKMRACFFTASWAMSNCAAMS